MEPIKNPKVERLAFTLRNSGIAYSESEARRMAQNMVSTEKKVQRDFEKHRAEMDEEMDRRKRDMIGAMPPKPEIDDPDEPEEPPEEPPIDTEQAEDLEIKEVDDEAIKQENIEKMRENAIESKPVEIQIDYDTPKTTPEPDQTIQESVKENPELDKDVSLKELMDEDAEKVYAATEEKQVLPNEVHEKILENRPSDKYNYMNPDLEPEKPLVVELQEVSDDDDDDDDDSDDEPDDDPYSYPSGKETKEITGFKPSEELKKPAPAKKIDTSEEEKVDLSSMFNFSNR